MVIGAAGMLGPKLAERLARDGILGRSDISPRAGGGYRPRLVFSSSIAVFGTFFPEVPRKRWRSGRGCSRGRRRRSRLSSAAADELLRVRRS